MAEVIASAGWRRALFLIKIRKGLFCCSIAWKFKKKLPLYALKE